MWKSLFVTSGEVLVFMDADLVDWDTHIVPGLLGPMLGDPSVELVKGFYERPGIDGGALDGGRVTELVARPLIALTAPELAGLVQPLAGEWAIRRSLFETLSVPTGYAVELAALLDVVAAHGISAIAQVDLGRRAHDHQALLDLGAMATQILAAVERRRGRAPGEVCLTQYEARGGELRSVERAVIIDERPPAVSV
jgi:glucosyl-3-phosphoglycerate synthase